MNVTDDTEPTTTQHTTDPRVARTQAAVIDAAVELLTAEGPAALTHAAVAAAADVSRTTVYNHWPTREDLLRAAIDSIGVAVPALDELTGSLRDDLSILCRPMVRHLLDERRAAMVASMMERAMHDHAVVEIRDEYLAAFTAVFEHIIGAAVATGALRADLGVAESEASIFGSLLFLRFMSATGLTTAAADAVLDEFVRANSPR